jgi:hypothetical protein
MRYSASLPVSDKVVVVGAAVVVLVAAVVVGAVVVEVVADNVPHPAINRANPRTSVLTNT